MDEQLSREERLPGEVVEVYRRPDHREVVEVYSRPLPGYRAPVSQPPVGKKRRKRGLWIFLACFAVLSALAAGAWLWSSQKQEASWDGFDYYYEEREDRGSREITIPQCTAEEGTALVVEKEHGPSLTAQEIYRQVNPAVVTVIAQLGEDGASLGTGVIFDGNGYILTNYHVLEGGSNCTITLDTGRTFDAQYVAGDAQNDLAILKTDQTGLPAADFGDSDALVVGDKVYAIGNPLGWELRGTLTDGIVSAINRDVWGQGRTMTLIHTNAGPNSGNSGGPLINEYGQVVGINTIKMSSSYSNIEGLGFAIPSASIRSLVRDLLLYGEVQPEPVLGVTVMQVGVQVAEGLWGVEVMEITPGSAAEKAGIQVGDYILYAGGVEILTSSDLLRVRHQYRVGDDLPVVLWRGGEELEVTLHLEQSADN